MLGNAIHDVIIVVLVISIVVLVVGGGGGGRVGRGGCGSCVVVACVLRLCCSPFVILCTRVALCVCSGDAVRSKHDS